MKTYQLMLFTEILRKNAEMCLLKDMVHTVTTVSPYVNWSLVSYTRTRNSVHVISATVYFKTL
jgi:hypothetical protein